MKNETALHSWAKSLRHDLLDRWAYPAYGIRDTGYVFAAGSEKDRKRYADSTERMALFLLLEQDIKGAKHTICPKTIFCMNFFTQWTQERRANGTHLGQLKRVPIGSASDPGRLQALPLELVSAMLKAGSMVPCMSKRSWDVLLNLRATAQSLEMEDLATVASHEAASKEFYSKWISSKTGTQPGNNPVLSLSITRNSFDASKADAPTVACVSIGRLKKDCDYGWGQLRALIVLLVSSEARWGTPGNILLMSHLLSPLAPPVPPKHVYESDRECMAQTYRRYVVSAFIRGCNDFAELKRVYDSTAFVGRAAVLINCIRVRQICIEVLPRSGDSSYWESMREWSMRSPVTPRGVLASEDPRLHVYGEQDAVSETLRCLNYRVRDMQGMIERRGCKEGKALVPPDDLSVVSPFKGRWSHAYDCCRVNPAIRLPADIPTARDFFADPNTSEEIQEKYAFTEKEVDVALRGADFQRKMNSVEAVNPSPLRAPPSTDKEAGLPSPLCAAPTSKPHEVTEDPVCAVPIPRSDEATQDPESALPSNLGEDLLAEIANIPDHIPIDVTAGGPALSPLIPTTRHRFLSGEHAKPDYALAEAYRLSSEIGMRTMSSPIKIERWGVVTNQELALYEESVRPSLRDDHVVVSVPVNLRMYGNDTEPDSMSCLLGIMDRSNRDALSVEIEVLADMITCAGELDDVYTPSLYRHNKTLVESYRQQAHSAILPLCEVMGLPYRVYEQMTATDVDCIKKFFETHRDEDLFHCWKVMRPVCTSSKSGRGPCIDPTVIPGRIATSLRRLLATVGGKDVICQQTTPSLDESTGAFYSWLNALSHNSGLFLEAGDTEALAQLSGVLPDCLVNVVRNTSPSGDGDSGFVGAVRSGYLGAFLYHLKSVVSSGIHTVNGTEVLVSSMQSSLDGGRLKADYYAAKAFDSIFRPAGARHSRLESPFETLRQALSLLRASPPNSDTSRALIVAFHRSMTSIQCPAN